MLIVTELFTAHIQRLCLFAGRRVPMSHCIMGYRITGSSSMTERLSCFPCFFRIVSERLYIGWIFVNDKCHSKYCEMLTCDIYLKKCMSSQMSSLLSSAVSFQIACSISYYFSRAIKLSSATGIKLWKTIFRTFLVFENH